MREEISVALRWLAIARELLDAEPFTEEFRRLFQISIL
jgi:hypothetical protein